MVTKTIIRYLTAAAKKISFAVFAFTGKTIRKSGEIVEEKIHVPHQVFSEFIQEIPIKVIHKLNLVIEQKTEI